MSIHRIVSIDLESASYVEIQKVIDLLTKELGTPEVKVDPGEGYRLLADDEVIKTGDEFWSIDQNVWTLTTFQGFTPEEQDLTYRRKLAAPEPTLDPGEGYRLLKDDEVIQEGDEYWATSCKVWDYSTCVGSTPEKQCCVYRRKIAPHNGVSVCELGKVYTAGAVPYLTVGTDHFS
jgi:hypothetical protein